MAEHEESIEIEDWKTRLLSYIPESLRVLGNIVIHEKFPDLFPFSLHTLKTDKNELTVMVNPENVSKYLPETNSMCLFSSTDDALKSALASGAVNWSKPIVMDVVPDTYITSIQEIASKMGGTIEIQESCHIFYLGSNDNSDRLLTRDAWMAKQGIGTKSIDKISIKKLQTFNEATTIADNWKHTTDKLREMIETIVKTFDNNIGIYVNSEDGEQLLVSWILESVNANQGQLHTLEEYRGRGFAKLAVSEISHLQLKKYNFTYAFVEIDNYISQQLYRSLGFKQSEQLFHWVEYKPMPTT